MWKPRLSRGSVSDSVQPPAGRVVAAQRAGQGGDRHRQPVLLPQPLGDGVVHLGRRGDAISAAIASAAASSSAKWLPRSSKKSRASSFGSRTRRPGRQRDAAGVLARHAPGAIQRQHRARRIRRAAGQRRRPPPPAPASRPSSGSAKTSRRPLSSCLLARPDSAARSTRSVSPSLISSDGGHRALVVLDQVQVAGGDAEPGGQRLLRQPLFRAQPADRAADQRAGHALHPLQIHRLRCEDGNSICRTLPDLGMTLRTCNVNYSRTDAVAGACDAPDPTPTHAPDGSFGGDRPEPGRFDGIRRDYTPGRRRSACPAASASSHTLAEMGAPPAVAAAEDRAAM